jgi:hypothetical protein
MTAGDSISASDRDLIRRLTIVLAFLFVFTAAFSTLVRVYSQKFFDRTAGARWIWAHHAMSANEPLAFFAAREITLPPNRVYTRIKILGDPEYTLYLNGREVAGRLVGEDKSLDLYDVSELVKTGRNRIVVAVRAPKGVGALLVAVDIAPETENWVVSDGQWKIYRWLDPLLLQYDIAGRWESPAIIGEPPIGRWNYLDIARRPFVVPPASDVQPKEVFATEGLVPTIRTHGGVAVAGTERAKATAFDFGFTRGRVRLTVEKDSAFSRVVQVRFANARNELGYPDPNLRPMVFAPGEREVTTPEERTFRYVMAFMRGGQADVLR